MNEDDTVTDDDMTIRLPSSLVSRVEARLPYADYDAVDEYVAFVLREVLARVERDREETSVDRATVQRRLESLGYLDE